MDRLRILSRRDFLTYLGAGAVSATAVGIGGIALGSAPEPSPTPQPDSTATTPPADATKQPVPTMMITPTLTKNGALCMKTNTDPESIACARKDGITSWQRKATDSQGIEMRVYLPQATPITDDEFDAEFGPDAIIATRPDEKGRIVFIRPDSLDSTLSSGR